MIPKIIHQTWKTNDLPNDFKKYSETWIHHHSEWKYKFYNDDDCDAFVAKHFPHLLEQYNGYQKKIQQIDFFRLLVVFAEGGLYADMDMECYKNIDELLLNKTCVFCIEDTFSNTRANELKYKKNFQIANCIFAAEPQNKFIGDIIKKTTELFNQYKDFDESNMVYNNVEDTTGPRMITRLYHEGNHDVHILPSIVWMPPTSPNYPDVFPFNIHMYAKHHFAGTWKENNESNENKTLACLYHTIPPSPIWLEDIYKLFIYALKFMINIYVKTLKRIFLNDIDDGKMILFNHLKSIELTNDEPYDSIVWSPPNSRFPNETRLCSWKRTLSWKFIYEWAIMKQYKYKYWFNNHHHHEKKHNPELHQALYRILKRFDQVMKDQNIKYFLDSGSLLGAYRDKGIIHYDDDLDIGVLKEEYDKIRDWEDKDYSLELNRNDTIYCYEQNMVNGLFIEKKTGTYIDIFCFKKINKGDNRYFTTFVHIGKDARKGAEENRMYCRKSEIYPLKKMQFGVDFYPVPNKTELILKRLYGDDLSPSG
tara:strand:- start:4143 stop:5747 length:1605 start_codon:yes stop_codon:yes gene_type:complete